MAPAGVMQIKTIMPQIDWPELRAGTPLWLNGVKQFLLQAYIKTYRIVYASYMFL